MTRKFPPAPSFGTPLPSTHASQDARDLLALRRSASKHHLAAPGPQGDELTELLNVAARVPDHRRLEPWRFIVFTGDTRVQFGQTLAKIHDANTLDADQQSTLEAAGLPLRAPTVIAVISSPDKAHKTPVWEQELSAGALCQNLLLAANAAGWAGVWLSEWIAFDASVNAALGLTPDERVAGYIYLGTATLNAPERARPDIAKKITHWSA